MSGETDDRIVHGGCWCASIRAAGAPQNALCEPCKDRLLAATAADLEALRRERDLFEKKALDWNAEADRYLARADAAEAENARLKSALQEAQERAIIAERSRC